MQDEVEDIVVRVSCGVGNRTSTRRGRKFRHPLELSAVVRGLRAALVLVEDLNTRS